jgi:hypothetical protein
MFFNIRTLFITSLVAAAFSMVHAADDADMLTTRRPSLRNLPTATQIFVAEVFFQIQQVLFNVFSRVKRLRVAETLSAVESPECARVSLQMTLLQESHLAMAMTKPVMEVWRLM